MSFVNPNQAAMAAVVVPTDNLPRHSAPMKLSLFDENGDPIDIGGGDLTNQEVYDLINGPEGILWKGSEAVQSIFLATALTSAFGTPTNGQVLGFNGTSVGWITP